GRRRITAALVALLVLVGGGWLLRDLLDESAADPSPGSGMRVERLTSLPAEAGRTWRLIEAGGPFPQRQDGTVFGNREGLLPEQESGYYREYTVPTPGSPDRGARRLVTGESDELYYTEDHYQSFVVVDPSR
ncbi:MAG: ribonuclease domain-containing protein, partial [Thermocrispum sp.]